VRKPIIPRRKAGLRIVGVQYVEEVFGSYGLQPPALIGGGVQVTTDYPVPGTFLSHSYSVDR